ncbi:MAG TPA: hypothetical protein VGV57_12755 [Thermoleophilaceae bacterium]|nr:hypothetical protein [Thermoleophilaceae bacterium]
MTGKVFAMLVQEEPVGKLPAARCVEVVVTGAARPFESGGRRLRESVSIANRTRGVGSSSPGSARVRPALIVADGRVMRAGGPGAILRRE